MILFASDHAGLELKRRLLAHLEAKGIDVEDLGPLDDAPVDYSDLAHLLAERVGSDGSALGVLICGTGIGMSMAANRHRGVRAALCHDAYTAEMSRRHNNANVLCLGGRVLGSGVAEQMVDVFLASRFEGGRHARRVDKIEIKEDEQ